MVNKTNIKHYSHGQQNKYKTLQPWSTKQKIKHYSHDQQNKNKTLYPWSTKQK